MFEPVTITSNVVAIGWPLGCGVGIVSWANAPRIGQRTGSHLVSVVATPLWGVWIFQAGRSRRRTAPWLQRSVGFAGDPPSRRFGVASMPATTDSLECLELSLEAQGCIRGRGRLVLGGKKR